MAKRRVSAPVCTPAPGQGSSIATRTDTHGSTHANGSTLAFPIRTDAWGNVHVERSITDTGCIIAAGPGRRDIITFNFSLGRRRCIAIVTDTHGIAKVGTPTQFPIILATCGSGLHFGAISC